MPTRHKRKSCITLLDETNFAHILRSQEHSWRRNLVLFLVDSCIPARQWTDICNTRCSILSRFSHFYVSHFPPLQHGAAFSCPTISCLAFSASPLEIGLLTATFRECEISFSHRPCWTSIALKKSTTVYVHGSVPRSACCSLILQRLILFIAT